MENFEKIIGEGRVVYSSQDREKIGAVDSFYLSSPNLQKREVRCWRGQPFLVIYTRNAIIEKTGAAHCGVGLRGQECIYQRIIKGYEPEWKLKKVVAFKDAAAKGEVISDAERYHAEKYCR